MKYSLSNQYCQRWTKGAKECFFRGGRCEGCITFGILGYRCRMKQSVLELVRKYGVPTNDEDTLTERQQKVIDAILNGANTKDEIAKYTGLEPDQTQGVLSQLYQLAESEGVVYISKGFKLAQFIDWVRGKDEL